MSRATVAARVLWAAAVVGAVATVAVFAATVAEWALRGEIARASQKAMNLRLDALLDGRCQRLRVVRRCPGRPGGIPALRVSVLCASETLDVVETAVNGMHGTVRLRMAVDGDGEIVALAIPEHHEQIGLGRTLGEAGLTRRLVGHGLGDPPDEQWRLVREGGRFDAITAATVTSRAIVDGARELLQAMPLGCR